MNMQSSILNVIENVPYGGVNTVVEDLQRNLSSNFAKYDIVTSEFKIKKQFTNCRPWMYTRSFKDTILSKVDDYTIFHIHGLWNYPQYIASKFAFHHNIPYIFSVHGMLEEWSFSKSKFKKSIYFSFIMANIFKKSAVLHAITESERMNLRTLVGDKVKIKIIPNLIDDLILADDHQICRSPQEKYILFVGRLHNKKGIDLLIDAFSLIKGKHDLKLKIVGSDFNKDNSYMHYLINLVQKLNIEDYVEFLGYIQGTEKLSLYKNAFVVIAPSHSEVIGMVNLESALAGTPVITTYETGIHEDWNINGGILIHPSVNSIQQAIEAVLCWSDEERNDRGRVLRDHVVKRYGWSNNKQRWLDLYDEALSTFV